MKQNASTAKVTISQILFADIYLDATPDTCGASQFTYLCCHNPCSVSCVLLWTFMLKCFYAPEFLSSLPVFSPCFLFCLLVSLVTLVCYLISLCFSLLCQSLFCVASGLPVVVVFCCCCCSWFTFCVVWILSLCSLLDYFPGSLICISCVLPFNY